MWWIVEGCLKWRDRGLAVPDIIEESTAEYRERQDPLRDFLEEMRTFDSEAYVGLVIAKAIRKRQY